MAGKESGGEPYVNPSQRYSNVHFHNDDVITVLLEYFAGEKPLRMSQISRKFDPLRVYNLGFADFIVAN